MLSSLLVLIPLMGAVTDIERALNATLNEGTGTVAEVQAAWAETMGIRRATKDGVVASGYQVRVTSLDPATLKDEVPAGTVIRHYVDVFGHGSKPLQLFVPKDPDNKPLQIYRRVEPGLFVKPSRPAVSVGSTWKIDVTFPGQFVVGEDVAAESRETPREKGLFPSFPPSVADPARKWHWRIFRVGAHEAVGRVPLIMIHGASTDRWGEFSHWVRFSPEAAKFRKYFQLWNLSHNMSGINAPIGFDPNCPEFDESIVAYFYRILEEATTVGTTTGDEQYKFPAKGPITMITNSHGALKARAFMVNFPAYGDRVIGVVSLGGPHMGTPWATPEWLRYTASRFGFSSPTIGDMLVDDALTSNYVSLSSQSDLDAGWPNFDAAGGFGIPYQAFTAWTSESGIIQRVLSPRDANITGARQVPGYDDKTFDPKVPLETYCGGMEHITPAQRGDLYMDRFFLYGSFFNDDRSWLEMVLHAGDGIVSAESNIFENTSLSVINFIMGFVPSAGSDWPTSPYSMGDGFVPLQSQLMLDGLETRPIYKTIDVFGWTVPATPFVPDLELIKEHTLGNPDRIRIFPGWSHLDTVTGRYNKQSGHSELFVQVAADLLSTL